jgi:hypothetical protein
MDFGYILTVIIFNIAKYILNYIALLKKNTWNAYLNSFTAFLKSIRFYFIFDSLNLYSFRNLALNLSFMTITL